MEFGPVQRQKHVVLTEVAAWAARSDIAEELVTSGRDALYARIPGERAAVANVVMNELAALGRQIAPRPLSYREKQILALVMILVRHILLGEMYGGTTETRFARDVVNEVRPGPNTTTSRATSPAAARDA